MTDLPIALPADLAARLADVLDVEGKIAAALQALGPIAGRDVAFVDTVSGRVVDAVRGLGARTRHLPLDPAAWNREPEECADAVVGMWSAFRGVEAKEIAAAERLLRAGGRLLILHDYGRDDVARLRGDLPEYTSWSRRNGPFLGNGFRVRVLHCFWTFDSLEDMLEFLAKAFGAAGAELGGTLKRPRLSWNVAVYHRSRLLP